MSLHTPLIYYGENAELPTVSHNSLGDTVYNVPPQYADLVPLLQEQAGAYYWPTVHQIMGEDDHVDGATVQAWRDANPPLK